MYNEIIFRPLYNILVGIMDVLPWIDVGLAVILFTVIIKIILFPLSKSALVTQLRMKEVEAEANKIKTQYANDKQAQTLKTMELYKQKGIKPFSGILLLIIQLPILLSLIQIFYKIIPVIDPDHNLLYSFVSSPVLKTMFLGLIDLTHPSLILAIATGVVQFLQLKYSLAAQASKPAPGAKQEGAAAIMGSMNTQMRYMVPILAFVSIYWLIPARFPEASSIIALYWMTSSLMTFLQELVIRKRYLNK